MTCKRTFLLTGCVLFGTLWTNELFGQDQVRKAGTKARSDCSTLSRSPIPCAPIPEVKAVSGEDEFLFRAKVEEVSLHATVTDKKRRQVMDLERGNFTVYEDGKPQEITSFRHEDVPVAMGIVIDNSGSMLDKRDRVNKAAMNLILASNRQDQLFVVNFNDRYHVDQDFTGNIAELEEALGKIRSSGGTALYDALIAAAHHLNTSQLQKKIIIVVTDGEDNVSSQSLHQTVELLQHENGPTVYAIGILASDSPKRARQALEAIAEGTGGIAFTPKTVDRVDQISAMVAHDIRGQYTLAYKPSNRPSNGGYRRIRVEAKARGHKDLVVRTRSGYYAGAERAAR